jgi:hypothetical protein
MDVKQFIEENFDVYEVSDTETWRAIYFTPISEIGQLCMSETPLHKPYYNIIEGVPLYTWTWGIGVILSKFYNKNVSTMDIEKVLIEMTNKIKI